ncbi:MAG: hypothetical protein HY282_17265 [Nitrospirae bacterium]|nr:hypothetical protein [Candidatus Manganitrophaceae bacterium]
MISRNDVKKLLAFENGDAWVTTLSLNVDGRALPKRQGYSLVFKNLLKQTRADLEQAALSPQIRASIEADFNRMEAYLRDEFQRSHHRGLLIYACSRKGLWQPLSFPVPLRSKLVVQPHPYTLPLTSLLDQYPKYGVVVVSQERARIFEVYLGEIVEHSEIYDEVPGKVHDPESREFKSMAWYGLAERRLERRGRRSESGVGGGNSESSVYGLAERKIERHVENHVRHHFKRIADTTFTFFRDHHFDSLILGGQPENVNGFESTLHRYLASRIIGRIKGDPKSSLPELLEESLQVIQQAESEQKDQLIQRIKDANGPNGLGVLGLAPTLHALMQGGVQTLVVHDGATLPGGRCPSCGHLTLQEEAACPDCGTATEPIPDLVEEAIEEAILQGAQVVHLQQHPVLSESQGMAALLRYQPARNTNVAKGAA